MKKIHNKIGDNMLFRVFYRTIFFYLLVVISYKIMGKREVGELSVFDFIISMLISQLIAVSIENYKDSIWFVIIPLITLVIFQVLIAKFSLKSNKFRDLIDGKQSVIISKGKLNFREMIKQRYNLDDLLLQLREQQIRSIEEVDYAILENNGKLSVFIKKDKDKNVFPLPIILDGIIQEDNLYFINKNRNWVINIINKKKLKLNNIFYAFYKNDELFIIKKDD
ncbi:MAG: DUF421 domain-containing protein [Bacilli bacterium]|nr:DUF421 domain-containing protein [Bacilli bacterium]